jgi:hypothetical protein
MTAKSLGSGTLGSGTLGSGTFYEFGLGRLMDKIFKITDSIFP